jgi:hypothetical protein
MTATPNSALALNEDGCLDDRRASDRAMRRHRLITIAQDALLAGVPSVVMASILAIASFPHALVGGFAMVGAQHIAPHLVRSDDEDAEGVSEKLAIGIGSVLGLAAMIATSALTPTLFIIWLSAAIALLLWPEAFHRIRGSIVTDYERIRHQHEHPATGSCASAHLHSNSPTSFDVTNGAARATAKGD